MEKDTFEKRNLILAIVFSAIFLFAVDAPLKPRRWRVPCD